MEEAASDLNQRIAERVRELRAAQGLSLDALAGKSGVSRSMISLIERGESSPTAVVLEKLAAGLGVMLASLFDAPAAAAQAPQRPGGAARRPAAVARPGLGLPVGATSRRRACRSRCRSSRCSSRPAGAWRSRPARATCACTSRCGCSKARSTSRWARSATDCAKAIAWPCSSTARRCSTTRRESPRAMPW